MRRMATAQDKGLSVYSRSSHRRVTATNEDQVHQQSSSAAIAIVQGMNVRKLTMGRERCLRSRRSTVQPAGKTAHERWQLGR